MQLVMDETDFDLLSVNAGDWADSWETVWSVRVSEASFENYTRGKEIDTAPGAHWFRVYWFDTYTDVILAKSFLADQGHHSVEVLADLRGDSMEWMILTDYRSAYTRDHMKLTPREVVQVEAALGTEDRAELEHEAEEDHRQQLHDEMINDAMIEDGRFG